MRLVAHSILIAAFLALAGAAAAGPVDDGLAAYGSNDFATALRLWRPLAEQGDARAQVYLGTLYDWGHGVTQNRAEAAKWFRKAADQGYIEGQIDIGMMYEYGHGVDQSFAEAAKWYRLAADKGDANGQNYLCILYENGQGVPLDYVVAYMWCNLAAAQGVLVGDRDRLARKMTPEQISEAWRLTREWKPK